MEELNGFQIEENKSQGYIKMYRSFKAWEWYDDANTARVFFHCLLSANHKSQKWRGKFVERGSFITSYRKIANELNIGIQAVRTAIENLKNTGEITHKTTRHYSIISIKNYELYQENNTQTDTQSDTQNNTPETQEQQTNNTQVTTNNNDKNIKNDNKEKKKNFIAKSFFQKLIAEDEEIKKYSSLKDLFIEFLEYKTQIKKQFKTENSVRNAFLDFVRLSNNDVNLGRLLVDNSIARGWQSIYDLSAEQRRAYNAEKQKNHQMQDENYGSF